MGWSAFGQGFLIGLAYTAPIGIQNLFVINAALSQSRMRALLTAWTVIFFDVLFVLVCFFGIGAVMAALPLLKNVIWVVGSLVVAGLGINMIRARGEVVTNRKALPLKHLALQAFFITFFNPQAIIDNTMLVGVFASVFDGRDQVPFLLGMALASFSWFTFVALIVSTFNQVIRKNVLTMVNVICGTVMLGYGLHLFYRFMQTQGWI